MGWKSTLLIFALAVLTISAQAQRSGGRPDNRQGQGRPSNRPGARGRTGNNQTEANLEQRGDGRRDGGRRNEGRSRPGEQSLDGQGRQGVEGGEGAEFEGQGGFRRRGGKPFFGQGERREGCRQGGPDGDMSPMPFGGGRRSDRTNETEGDESFPGRYHGRNQSLQNRRHHHHHGRRNESEESEEGENNGTRFFPFLFRHHGNRRHRHGKCNESEESEEGENNGTRIFPFRFRHHGKCNNSEEYGDEEDNNGTRISVFDNAPFGRPSRRRHHPCNRNRTGEENAISDGGDRRDQSGRDGGRRGGGRNGHPFQRPGNGGRCGDHDGPFGCRGDRNPKGDGDNMTTVAPIPQTEKRENDEV